MRNKWIERLLPKTSMFSVVPFAVMALGLLVSGGAFVVHTTPGTQAATMSNTNLDIGLQPSVQCRVVETHTIQYVEKPVVQVKYVERVERVPVELKNFTSLEELEQWLARKMNVTTVYFQSLNTIVDCDDYALALQRKSLEDGYMMSFQIIEPDRYNDLFRINKMPPNTFHAINLVLIGNSAYYIEPQTGEIVFAAYLD